MTKYFSSILMLALCSNTYSDCVQMLDHQLDRPIVETQNGMVGWSAKLKNNCDDIVDVYLTIHFNNEDEESLYSIQAIKSLGHQEEKDITKNAYIPSRVVDQAVDLEVKMKERKRLK